MFYINIVKQVEIYEQQTLAQWLLDSGDITQNISEIEITFENKSIRYDVIELISTIKNNIPCLIATYSQDSDDIYVAIPLDDILCIEYFQDDTLIRVVLKYPHKDCVKQILVTHEI